VVTDMCTHLHGAIVVSTSNRDLLWIYKALLRICRSLLKCTHLHCLVCAYQASFVKLFEGSFADIQGSFADILRQDPTGIFY